MSKKKRINENSTSYTFRKHGDRKAGFKNYKLLGRMYLKI